MASMWRRAMLYLGLGPDDEYDDGYAPIEDQHAAPAHAHAPAPAMGQRYVPPEPPEAQMSAVRPLPREVEPQPSGVTPVRRQSSVVKPLVPQGPSPKPYAISPTSFNDAQDVADKFMAGGPVIVNLQGKVYRRVAARRRHRCGRNERHGQAVPADEDQQQG